jgi:hypothetical protein
LLFLEANQGVTSAALDKREEKCFQTLSEKASLQNKCNQLQHCMRTLLEVQKIYISGLASLEADFAHETTCLTGKSTHDGSALGI